MGINKDDSPTFTGNMTILGTLDTKGLLTAESGAIITGTLTNAGIVKTIKPRLFTGSGTYTPTTGMIYCIIECVGGGGGSGGVALTGAGTQNASGGGGGGSYARLVATATTIGSSQTVTIGTAGIAGTVGNNPGGAGGDTSVGTLCIGKGGSPSSGAAASAQSAGGAGGISGAGDFTIVGGAGTQGGVLVGSGTTVFPVITGRGGDSFFGYGGAAVTTANSPNPGQGYGGGAGGVSDNNGGNRAGAAGSAGVVFITEFCSQ
jgi:hypothetical protein